MEKRATSYIDTLSDADLVSLYQKEHNQQHLATLYLRYSDLLLGVCLKYLKDHAAAEDAVMSIYETLIEKVKHHQIETFRSWVYVVARNHCLMMLRKEKQMPTAEFSADFMQSEESLHPDDVVEREDRLNQLENCIEKLKEEQKQTIKLFYLEQKCYHEIAAVTGLDWNKVRSLIQNGRRNLKICMESHES